MSAEPIDSSATPASKVDTSAELNHRKPAAPTVPSVMPIEDASTLSNEKRGKPREEPMNLFNWPSKINWLNTTLILLIPIYGFLAVPFVPLVKKTAIWALTYYAITGLGITTGYHRLWSHRSYTAALPLRLFLALAGAGAGEGSIKWWATGHRVHHRYTDMDKDPYDARKGFWFSHMGWMVFKQNGKLKGRVDNSDLVEDPIVRFQHKHYNVFLIIMAYLFPMILAGLAWGDWLGGFLYAGVLRLFVVHQSTFCVNSLAHWIGEQPFDDRRTPRNHFLTALVTFGEGYHNFHHEFPSDYRNALKWFQYDPSKVCIWIWSKIGLASHLQTFSQNAIEQGMVQQKQKKLDRWRAKLDWGIPIEQLPVIEFDDFKDQSKNSALVLIGGIVHDVTDFIERHPGGKALISSAIGKDATAVFNGGVYRHSNAAHNLLAAMRVAVIRGGCEVAVWRRAHQEKKNVDLVSDSTGERIVRAGAQPTMISGNGLVNPAA